MAKVIKGTGAPIGTSEELGAISPDTGFADVVRKRPAVVSKEVFDAGNEAKRITADAEQKAAQIIAEAEAKAAEIQQQAQVEAEQLRAGAEKKGFADKNGYELKVPDTWQELDQMLAWFHRPDKGKFGGALFRTQYFIAWEWWGRFHAKGFYPLADDLKPQINNDAGIAALEELIAASQYLYPGAKTNGLFENFEAFGEGDKFVNIGWGGTQKFLNSDKSKIKGKLGTFADAVAAASAGS